MKITINGKTYVYYRKDYYREYMRNKRAREKMKKLTGFSMHPRFLDENLAFNKEDLEYIKTMQKDLTLKNNIGRK